MRVTSDPDMPAILLDDQQIIRALANIIRNAIEAIETRRSEQAERDGSKPEADIIKMECRIDNDTALIEVTDTGCGIESEHLGKVFEPHFTTKFSGSGLG